MEYIKSILTKKGNLKSFILQGDHVYSIEQLGTNKFRLSRPDALPAGLFSTKIAAEISIQKED